MPVAARLIEVLSVGTFLGAPPCASASQAGQPSPGALAQVELRHAEQLLAGLDDCGSDAGDRLRRLPPVRAGDASPGPTLLTVAGVRSLADALPPAEAFARACPGQHLVRPYARLRSFLRAAARRGNPVLVYGLSVRGVA
jgi:hypothetical protein